VPPPSRPTIVDVARIAGVSPATVSYVVSGPRERAARISEETTTRILEVVDELGYVPNQSARTLRLQRTNRVLFLAARLTSVYSQVMASSIERGLERHGLALSVQVGSGLDSIERSILMLEQRHADGLIVETDDSFVPEFRVAAADGHAIVAIGPTTAEPSFDVMSVNDRAAVEDAMTHVVERGYRHFALLSSLPNAVQEHRIDVANRQLRELGIEDHHITLRHCPHDRMTAYEAAMTFIPDMPRPLAVYAGSDVSAFGVLWACHRLGVRVPEDVAIIGHGNAPETHITVPTLTSLGPTNSDFSRAADLMASRLKNRSLPGRQIIEPCQLSVRESSQPRNPPIDESGIHV
jgi:DNA-binding LacI/PurR family transcriptional regulator